MGLKTGLAFAVDTTTIEFKTDIRASCLLSCLLSISAQYLQFPMLLDSLNLESFLKCQNLIDIDLFPRFFSIHELLLSAQP